MDNPRRPIIYKGELYNAPVERKRTYVPKDPPYDFDECRDKLLEDISNVQQKVANLDGSHRLPNEVVVCLRMRPEYGAKSHFPKSLFQSSVLGGQFEEIGSRIYRIAPTNSYYQNGQEFGKLFFVRATANGLDRFNRRIEDPTSITEQFKREVKTIESFDLINPSEQIVGFGNDWTYGNIEIVLHPFAKDHNILQEHFMKKLMEAGVKMDTVHIRQIGSSGLTFVNVEASLQIAEALHDYNPIRTAHPFELRSVGSLTRMNQMAGCPTGSAYTEQNRTVVGVIDGGYIPGNPSLDNYTETIEATDAPPDTDLQSHGAAVTSATLYGALNSFRNTDVLPEPLVKVRNFRVLGQGFKGTNPAVVLDKIEAVVRSNRDIQVFNLSLGPNSPIWEDEVDSWTLLLDSLSKELNITFVVAVGNNGTYGRDYGRIQAPSDMANGLSVAAYSEIDSVIERAPYSCFGPGREGAKQKPDLAAFGGCDRNPIHLLGYAKGTRLLSSGTSLAAPLVASAASKLIGAGSGAVNALTSRLLLIHSAESEKDSHCDELGFGALTSDLESILTCEGNTYTLIYEAEMMPGKIRQFKIPWTDEVVKGKVRLEWTVLTLTAVDDASPIDYTASSVITSIAPHAKKFRFSKKLPNNQTQNVIIDIQAEPGRAEELEADGFKRSQLPVAEGGLQSYASEGELREGLKWDTVEVHSVRKLCTSIYQPALYVEAKTRGSRMAEEKVHFAIALTVTTSSTEVDLYSEILQRFPALVPMQVQENIRISVR